MNRKAVTLIEITIACFILCIAILPLVTNSKNTALKAVETEKIQMAERILESIKGELMALKFDTFYSRAKSENLDENAIGPFPLNDGYYPTSINKVLEVQKKYKNFKVEGTWSWVKGENNKPNKTMVQADVMCSFTGHNKNEKPIERRKSFLIVRP